jgi:hypothetical protein
MTRRLGVFLPLSVLFLTACAPTPVPVLVDGIERVRYLRCTLKPDGEKLYSSNYIGEGVLHGYPPGSKVELTMFSAQRIDLKINNIPHKLYPSGDLFNGGDPNACFEKYFVESLAEIGLPPKDSCPPQDEAPPPSEDGGEDEKPAPEGEGEDGAGAAEAEKAPGDEAAAPQPVKAPAKKKAPNPGWRLDKMKPSVATSVKGGVAAVGMTKEQVYMAFGPPHFLNFDTVSAGLDLKTIMNANRWVYYTGWFPRTFTFGLAGKRTYLFDGTLLISVE